MKSLKFFVYILLTLNSSCNSENSGENNISEPGQNEINPPDQIEKPSFYYGADLSYLNEMIDCDAQFKNSDNDIEDPYHIFKNAGTNLVRVRLWHNPTWTNYSNLQDVERTMEKAKGLGMDVLLDFHYSDTWADPHKQEIPDAWSDDINNLEPLSKLLYNYTYQTLSYLYDKNLVPKIVQVGNEINAMILQKGELEWPIDWNRNATLLNKGIEAIRDFSKDKNESIEIMLHVAQPENGLWWFEQANNNGVVDYEWIGLSYYPKWSEYDLKDVNKPIKELVDTYDKRLMVVETAYPFTMENADGAGNILGSDAVVPGYPATQQGQLDYLNKLKDLIIEGGGEGLIYWEPAWVSTKCSTLWGQGSHWDNATLFDHQNKPTLGLQFYNASIGN